MEKLYGSDYIRLPLLELVHHEDYNEVARDTIVKVMMMNTDSLMALAIHIRSMEEQ